MNPPFPIRIVLEEEHPFISVGGASYELSSGISLDYCWEFDTYHQIKYIEYFKIALNNIFRQNDIDFRCSREDIKDNGITMFSAIISDFAKYRKKFYALAIFMDSSKIKSSPYINELIFNGIHWLGTEYYKFQTDENSEITDFSESIRKFSADYALQILNSGIKLKKFESISSDLTFLSQCLTSHLQTQMTTVIETPNLELCSSLYSLLSHFLLPEQLELSNDKLQYDPVPGLFLQCVLPQSQIPYEILFQFKRPWTWINVSKKLITQFTDFTVQNHIYKTYTTNVLYAVNPDQNKINHIYNRLSKTYVHFPIAPAEWTSDTIKILSKAPKSLCGRICEQKLLELVHKAVLLNDICTETMKSEQLNYLDTMHISDICRYMELKDRSELKIVVAISQLFYKNAYRRIFSGRKETIRQMISCI